MVRTPLCHCSDPGVSVQKASPFPSEESVTDPVRPASCAPKEKLTESSIPVTMGGIFSQCSDHDRNSQRNYWWPQ